MCIVHFRENFPISFFSLLINLSFIRIFWSMFAEYSSVDSVLHWAYSLTLIPLPYCTKYICILLKWDKRIHTYVWLNWSYFSVLNNTMFEYLVQKHNCFSKLCTVVSFVLTIFCPRTQIFANNFPSLKY